MIQSIQNTISNEHIGSICLQRRHGLGNLICLLPVLDRLHRSGYAVTVVTRQEWISAFSAMRPQFLWEYRPQKDAIDMDHLTVDLSPSEHRTDEFGRLLGMAPPFGPLNTDVPPGWSEPFEYLRGGTVFAPEGTHSSRKWPLEQAVKLDEKLTSEDQPLILVGTDRSEDIPAQLDTRGQLELEQLFGLIAVAGVVVTMDSAVLHIAAAMNKPTVALFGGIEPDYRVRPEQNTVVIQADMDCCPCNKDEICNERFDCIANITVQDVLAAIASAKTTAKRIIYKYQLAGRSLPSTV